VESRDFVNKMEKIMVITLGDPLGIGAEVVYKSLKRFKPQHSTVIMGDISDYFDKNIVVIKDINEIKYRGNYFFHINRTEIKDSDPSFEYVCRGTELALQNKVQALITAPISKKKWLEHHLPFQGHTDYLSQFSESNHPAMVFWSKDMKVALFTIHIPLKDVFKQIKEEKIVKFITFVDSELSRLFSKKFTFFICGLNPHAGESGFLGTEEKDVIVPALESLDADINIAGLYPPDIVFIKAMQVKESVVISWYHDQGLIPFKLKNFQFGVNLTLGLPFIRTSPDHGTAYDIAGKNIADPQSMIEALKLADFLVGNTT